MTSIATKSILAGIALAVTAISLPANAQAGELAQGAYNGEAQIILAGGGKRHRHKHRHGWHGGHGWGGHIVIGTPHRGCYYLKKKARYTGSHYWWKQYRKCVRYGYYY